MLAFCQVCSRLLGWYPPVFVLLASDPVGASDQEGTTRFTQPRSCVDALLREDKAQGWRRPWICFCKRCPVPQDTVSEKRSSAYCAFGSEVTPFGSSYVRRRARQRTGGVQVLSYANGRT